MKKESWLDNETKKQTKLYNIQKQKAVDHILSGSPSDLTFTTNMEDQQKPSYEEYLKAIIPPVKCVWDNKEWVVVENKNEQYKLIPCYKTTNNGEPIYLPHGTILTHLLSLNYSSQDQPVKEPTILKR